MAKEIVIPENRKLDFHIKEVLAGKRRFENANQAFWRMVSEKGVDKITRSSRTVYDFKVFREGTKHIIGWFDELTDLVSFVQDAAEGRSSKERAFVFVGEPGNG